MAITYAELEKLKEEMRTLEAPPRDNLTPNKQEAVRVLAGEIVELQRRGFTIEQVSAWLKGKGLDLNAPTLKNYLSRANSTKRRRRTGVAKNPKQKSGKVETKEASSKAKNIDDDSRESPERKKDPKAAFLATDKNTY